MNYLTEEQKEIVAKDQKVLEYVWARLYLSNIQPEEISAIVGQTGFGNREFKPYLKYADMEGFEEFDAKTPLATLKIQTYSNYEYSIGISTNTDKNGNPMETEQFLMVSNGNLYEKTVTIVESERGSSEVIHSKIRAKINLRIFYTYYDGDSVYVAYRVGRDRKTRIEELNIAITTIKGLYNLSARDGYLLKLYLEEVSKEFLKYDKPVDSALSIINGEISVTVPTELTNEANEKATLEALFNLYNITTQKQSFNLLALYSPILPLNMELRKRDCIVHIPMLIGKAGAGKSALAKLFVVNGFNNPEADRTEDNIYTKASFRELFSRNTLPIMIDEITAPVLTRIAGSIKSLATGSGKHSRGRIGGGLNEWQMLSIPVFTSNEMIYIDAGIERRLIKVIADDTKDNNIALWREYKAKVVDGFQYLILREMNGMNIDDFVMGIVRNVKKDEDFVVEYEKYILNIYRKLADKYGLECPFEVVEKLVFDDDDWYVAFGRFIEQNWEDEQNMNRPYLKRNGDYDKIGETFYVTKLGFQKFLKLFSRCPYRTASTFAINAPAGEYAISYVKKRVCGSKNPQHVIAVTPKEELQVTVTKIEEQLEKIQEH